MSITASATHHRPVDRDDLAGPHDDDIADLHLFDGHLLQTVADAQLRDLRGPLHERGQLAPCAPGGDRLERGATGEHQPDHDAGELLAERECSDHRHERDRVDAEAVLDDDRAPDLDRQLGGEQRHRRPPHRGPRRAATEQVQQASDDDRSERDRGEDLRAMLENPGQVWSCAVVVSVGPPGWACDGGRVGAVHDCRFAPRRAGRIRSVPRVCPGELLIRSRGWAGRIR